VTPLISEGLTIAPFYSDISFRSLLNFKPNRHYGSAASEKVSTSLQVAEFSLGTATGNFALSSKTVTVLEEESVNMIARIFSSPSSALLPAFTRMNINITGKQHTKPITMNKSVNISPYLSFMFSDLIGMDVVYSNKAFIHTK